MSQGDHEDEMSVLATLDMWLQVPAGGSQKGGHPLERLLRFASPIWTAMHGLVMPTLSTLTS